MGIDYDRLRELLDEVSPGPWEVETFEEHPADCPEVTKLHLNSDDMQNIAVAEATNWYYGQADSNFRLMALAPDMARELLRLRRELTDLRDLMSKHASYQRADGYGTAANWTRDHANRLARIMQGDTE